MFVLLLFLVSVVAAVALVLGVVALFDVIRGDGVGLPSWERTPPRSHHVDLFEPRPHGF